MNAVGIPVNDRGGERRMEAVGCRLSWTSVRTYRNKKKKECPASIVELQKPCAT